MRPEDLFEAWTPADSRWSPWAKPVLFAGLNAVDGRSEIPEGFEVPIEAPLWTPTNRSTAVVLDVDGPSAVLLGLLLARSGFQPVPLFNGADGPAPAVDVDPIIRNLVIMAGTLGRCTVANDAPPVFLLDDRRSGGGRIPSPGSFDNRWLVMPQDFPSGRMLKESGATEVLVVTEKSGIASDLEPVLHRWKDAGLTINQVPREGATPTQARLGGFWNFPRGFLRLIQFFGFRRNSAGGFGSRVPKPAPSGSHSGYRSFG